MYILDAGSGKAPYRELFSHAHYETADFVKVDKEYGHTDYVCDLATIPVEADRYDRIIFTQVMEHLPEPALVLNEFHRIMKPGGKIICTCPFMWEEHEIPYDYFRYTQFGLKNLFESAGFRVESIERVEGYFGTIAYQMWRFNKSLPILPRMEKQACLTDPRLFTSLGGIVSLLSILIFKPFSMLGSALFSKLDKIHKITDRGYPLNYCVLASKSDQSLG